MSTTILKLENLMKTYIIGNHKSAKQVLKAIQSYQRKSGDQTTLRLAQDLFAVDRYAESYRLVTGHKLRLRSSDHGTVVHALQGIDLEVKSGEMLAIMGPSGSGKSTLLNMLGLLDEPTTGHISLHGHNVSAIKQSRLPQIRSRELGFVFQSFNLISSLTALENVMLPLRYSGVPARRRPIMAAQALDQVGLGNRQHHSANELSGGQQQRVAIARSIVTQPQIILADELTGELDTAMTLEVMNLVLRLNRSGQTFILVTHNPDVARLCGRVIHMRDGKIYHEESKLRSGHWNSGAFARAQAEHVVRL